MDFKGEPGDLSAEGGGESDSATIHIRCSSGTKFSVHTTLGSTVAAFKVLLAEKCDVPVQQQRLIYKGRILKDEKTLKSYGLESDHAVHLVRGAALSSGSNVAGKVGDSGIKSSSAAGRDVSSVDVRDLDGVGVVGPLLNGLGANGQFPFGASGLFGSGFPEFDQVQQQLTQNPNMMRDILNTPAIQNLMNNPDLIRNLIMSNPQMRDILDRNPDLAHVLNDPSTLRQTLQAARNPELMREMMRNTDRAMSNIESSPEGFNMLRRMYETVQEPFLNATTMAGNTAGDGSNPFAALLGNQGNTHTRDGATNHLATDPDATNSSSLPNINPLPNPWSSAGGVMQTTNARSSPAGEERSAGIGGITGLRIPDLERMAGGLPDVLSQMLQNPTMAQMMESLLSNPQFMNQIFNMNPQLRAMMESNSHLREMLQNPEFLRQFASPETLQQVLSLQQSLLTLAGQQHSNQGQNQANISAGNAGAEYLMQLFGGLGARSNLDAPSNPDVPPEERYATQLAQLQEMGFFDTQENIRALVATAGNVHAAVERLLGNISH